MAITCCALGGQSEAASWTVCLPGPVNLIWKNNVAVMGINTISMPEGSPWDIRLRAAMDSWSNPAAGGTFSFLYSRTAAPVTVGDNVNQIDFKSASSFDPGVLAVTIKRYECPWIIEADVSFNADVVWNLDPPTHANIYQGYSFEATALHELGHVLGLLHEDTRLATMNTYYPSGGPLGSHALYWRPLADDLLGLRALYPWGAAAYDVAVSSFVAKGDGTVRNSQNSVLAYPGEWVNVEFTFMNRGSTEQVGGIGIYLSEAEIVDPWFDPQIRYFDVTAPSGATDTFQVPVQVPANLPLGSYYLSGVPIFPSDVNEFNNRMRVPSSTVVRAVAPGVTTASVSEISADSARLHGVVSSRGAAATAYFEFGESGSYGSVVQAMESPLLVGAYEASVTARLSNLACGRTYHYRAVGVNSIGTTQGADMAFVTSSCAGPLATTTSLVSDANPATSGTSISLTATVIGSVPSGNVTFIGAGVPIPGCTSVPLVGSGDVRVAMCALGGLGAGTHSLTANYGGDGSNAPSASAGLMQEMVVALPIVGTIVANPYGPMSVQGGTLAGNQVTLSNSLATIQLGAGTGSAGSVAQIDFQGLHVGAGNTLVVRSGAPGQVLVLRNVSSVGSAIGGLLRAEGGGAPPPQLYVGNAHGIAIAASGNVVAPAGLTLDAVDSSWVAGGNVSNAGMVDGGPYLSLYGANLRGGGMYKSDAIGLHTYGAANNPVHGSQFLQNGLQLYPSSGTQVALTLNGYGTGKQVFNLLVNGNATVWMPSVWPGGFTIPTNNAVVLPGGIRGAGVPEPAYGGGSMILQATGNLSLRNGGTNDFVFPGAIVLKAGATLDVNGVLIDQGWTTTGQAFQGIFFEAPSIVSSNGLIKVYGNDLNWINFSTFPHQYVRAHSLKRNGDGSASFAATDSTTPHLNTFSLIQNTAAAGGCWICQVNTQGVDMYGP